MVNHSATPDDLIRLHELDKNDGRVLSVSRDNPLTSVGNGRCNSGVQLWRSSPQAVEMADWWYRVPYENATWAYLRHNWPAEQLLLNNVLDRWPERSVELPATRGLNWPNGSSVRHYWGDVSGEKRMGGLWFLHNGLWSQTLRPCVDAHVVRGRANV